MVPPRFPGRPARPVAGSDTEEAGEEVGEDGERDEPGADEYEDAATLALHGRAAGEEVLHRPLARRGNREREGEEEEHEQTGFGIDSAIEGVASLVIVWRFTGSRLLSAAAESRAQKLVAVQFFLLAPYVTAEAIQKLVTAEEAEASWLGIGLVASSVVGMPLLGLAKRRLADRLGLVATRGEGTQNLLCAYLAAAVLVGLLGNTLFGLWWLDPVAPLVLAGVALREGDRTWRGEGCCATS